MGHFIWIDCIWFVFDLKAFDLILIWFWFDLIWFDLILIWFWFWIWFWFNLILIHLICIWFNWLIRRREWVCLGVPGGEQDQEVYRCGGNDSDTVRYIPRVQEEEVQGIPDCTACSLCSFRRNLRGFIRLSERETMLLTIF